MTLQSRLAPCQAHTPHTRHPCQHTLPRTPGTPYGLHSAPGPHCTDRTARLYQRSRRHTQHKPSSPRSARSHRHIPRMCHPSRLTLHHRARMLRGWQSAACLQRRARTTLQMSDHGSAPHSRSHSPRNLCGQRSAPAHSDTPHIADRRRSRAHHQSAHTSHSHPRRHQSAETDHRADHEDAIQVGSSRMSSRRHCADRRRTECTSTDHRSPHCQPRMCCIRCRPC